MRLGRFHSLALSRTYIMPLAAGIVVLPLAYYVRTWQSFTAVVDICPRLFCDFVDYYYPMGDAIFRSVLPVDGFLYSPFIAIVLAVFPPLGLDVSLVVWGILQALFVSLYVLVFLRLVPAGLWIQLLFVTLTLFSYPLLLNLMGGQVSVFMVVPILGMLVVNERGRRVAAACLLAFAVSFKFYPIIILVWFIARREIRFLLLAIAVCCVALFVVPGLVLGGGDTLRFYGGLFDSFRESGWVVTNPHSQFLPHVVPRLVDAAGQGTGGYLSPLHWIAYGVATANVGLLFLVQRARLPHADLWSFQLLFLTIPFILKTSWPHDFVFLPFTQAFLAWRLLAGEQVAPRAETAGKRSQTGAWRERTFNVRNTVTFLLLLVSIAVSNIFFFNVFGSFSRYGYFAFLFWADVLLLIASYMVLLPPVLRSLRAPRIA